MKIKTYDLIIIGGGALGLSCAYHASKEKKSTLLLEQFEFLNEKGSSGGCNRQFRVQYDDAELSQLVLDSVPYWNELQSSTSDQLLDKVGCLWFGDPSFRGVEGQIKAVTSVMESLGIKHTSLSGYEIEKIYNFKNIAPHWRGFFQPDGAAINVKFTLKTLHKLASVSEQVTLKENQKVLNIESTQNGVLVCTDEKKYIGKKLILVPGPYVNELLSCLGIQLDIVIWEMVSASFKMLKSCLDIPVWINFQKKKDDDAGCYYGFPENKNTLPGYVRVAAGFPSRIHHSVSSSKLNPSAETLNQISNWVINNMCGLEPDPLFSRVDLQALFVNNKDQHSLRHELLLDYIHDSVPFNKNIVICATGWVFKLVPLLGKICVDLAFGRRTPHQISSLRFVNDMLCK